MDTTKEFIKMCEKATELQEAWKPQSGDFVHSNVKQEIRVLYFSKHHGDPPEHYIDTHFTHWLPRQDQLQEMFEPRPHPIKEMSLLTAWLESVESNYYRQFHTHEQCWLSYCMYVKHNKTWNGEDWVKL